MVDSLAFLLSGGKCDVCMSPIISVNVASDVWAAGLVRCRRCEAEGWVPATMQGYVAQDRQGHFPIGWLGWGVGGTMLPVMRTCGAMSHDVAGDIKAARSTSAAIYSHIARRR